MSRGIGCSVKCFVSMGLLPFVGTAFAQTRIVEPLDKGWSFHLGNLAGDSLAPVTSKEWQPITLPHTWNNLDGQDGGSNYYRGVGWYRLSLFVPVSMREKSLFLRFEGAATVADVYVNGSFIGEHRGNFAAFCFDASKQLKPGKENEVSVRVDNSYNPDIPPLSGDFNIDGGLYRKVELLALNGLAISPLDDSSSGVYVEPVKVSRQIARFDVRAVLRNATGDSQAATLKCFVRDRAGTLVARGSSSLKVPAAGAVDSVSLSIRNPHLWNGVLDPYLYSIQVEVFAPEPVDKTVVTTGFRFFRADPATGFYLNGEPYSLHGVNKHQDRLNKGWACSDKDYVQDARLMQEVGATCVRFAHYQHPQIEYDLCDRDGIVAWAELPLVNKLGYTQAFDENARQQLRELIKQNYNHPSILFWSLFNELSFPSGAKNPEDWALIVELNKLAHSLDRSRLTTAATSLDIGHPVNFITDVIGVNRYYGWYNGKPEDWGPALDKMHARFPNRCIAISEYGAGASIYQHENPVVQPRPGSRWHPEEWQSHLHEVAWGALSQRHWLWGTFLWNMFDFAVDARNEGDTPGRNDKGLVTYDRRVRKDAFYFYKARWSKNPVLWIAESRFNPRPGGVVDVNVYSNLPAVSLKVNGQDLGSKRGVDHVFLWQNLSLEPGVNKIVASGGVGKQRQREEVDWNVPEK